MKYVGKLYGKIAGKYIEVNIEEEKNEARNEAIRAAAENTKAKIIEVPSAFSSTITSTACVVDKESILNLLKP
jgi:ribosomal protein S5